MSHAQAKIKVEGQLVKKTARKQTDEQKDTTDRINSALMRSCNGTVSALESS